MHLPVAIPATAALCYRAYAHKSLTPGGIIVAGITALAHAYHPWNLPYILLFLFYHLGSQATKNKAEIKAKLTTSATGQGEGPRTYTQVLANSLPATVFSLWHGYLLRQRDVEGTGTCCSFPQDILVLGIIANYLVVTADTLGSELGILSEGQPRLITTLRKVPRGTNGGVSQFGLIAGLVGSMIVSAASVVMLPFCSSASRSVSLFTAFSIWGVMGSLLDSLLGALFQSSVKDVRSGKIVEGYGGARVKVSSPAKKDAAKPSRVVESGRDILDNNQVNLLMATTMSVGAVVIGAWALGDGIATIF